MSSSATNKRVADESTFDAPPAKQQITQGAYDALVAKLRAAEAARDAERAAREAAQEREQQERAAKEAERGAKEAERAAREAAQEREQQERAAKEAERAAREAAQEREQQERAAKEAERAAREAAQEREQQERAAKEAERTAKEAAQEREQQERAAKEAALRKVLVTSFINNVEGKAMLFDSILSIYSMQMSTVQHNQRARAGGSSGVSSKLPIQGIWQHPLKELQDHLRTVYGVALPDITAELKALFRDARLTTLRDKLVACDGKYQARGTLNAQDLDEKRDVHPLAHVLFGRLYDIVRTKISGAPSNSTTSATSSSPSTQAARSPASVAAAVGSLLVYLEKLNAAGQQLANDVNISNSSSGGVSGSGDSGAGDIGGGGDGRRRLPRLEDVLFHTHAPATPPEKLLLNVCVQRKCATSVELKPTTKTAKWRKQETTQISSAINELERDYVATIFGERPLRVPFGLNVLGDGLTFYALRSQLALTEPRMRTVLSTAYDIDTEGGLVAFGTLFVHLIVVAALGSFDYEVAWALTALPDVAFQFDGVVSYKPERLVFRVRDTRSNARYVVKRLGSTREERREHELHVWMVHGAALASVSGIVRLHQWHFFDEPAFMYADDGAVVLEHLCFCDAATTTQLAAFVRQHIKAALDALHRLRLAFGDVHVGNIIVTLGGRWREAGACAKLIDVEAIQPFDDPDQPVPTARYSLHRWHFRPVEFERRHVGRATDYESLELTLCWLLVDEYSTARQPSDEAKRKQLRGLPSELRLNDH